MDYCKTKEQISICQEVKRFAQNELSQLTGQKFDKTFWQKCADFGLLGMCIPEEYGGMGLDYLTSAMILETLGKNCTDNGFIFAITNHIWVCQQVINQFGSAQAKQYYLPKLVSGEAIGCYAITEPDSGSDVFSMHSKAEEKKDCFILNGSKTFISNAPIADVFVVVANTIDQNGNKGLSSFIVEKSFDGLSVGNTIEKMGLEGCPMGELFFDNCIIPKNNLLFSFNKGLKVANWALQMERVFEFASHIGSMERIMDGCIKYSNERIQQGKQIKNYQSITNKIVDMKVSIEMARNYLYKVAWQADQGKNIFLESSIIKLFISENYVKTCMDALQIHGAYGYSKEYPYEAEVRDSLASTIYSGTSEIQKNIIFQLIDF